MLKAFLPDCHMLLAYVSLFFCRVFTPALMMHPAMGEYATYLRHISVG